MPTGIAEVDRSGVVVRSNLAFSHLLGHPSRIVPGTSLTSVQWPQIDTAEASHQAAEHAATHDPLTVLPNRTLLLQRLASALIRCEPGEKVAVIFRDVNDFKGVNDTYGPAVGDAVLAATANRLRAMIRPHDTAARLGGDEFRPRAAAPDPHLRPDTDRDPDAVLARADRAVYVTQHRTGSRAE